MTTLFEQTITDAAPLADRLRPRAPEEVIGQAHVMGESHMLRQMLEGGQPVSLVLWGPPGCGKTTLARIIAEKSGYEFEQVSAVASGVADLKAIFERARKRRQDGVRTLVFVDEIHRFNRAQQDAFLPVVEDGTITLIGATTENPSFEMNGALLSRMQVVVLQRLDGGAMQQLMARAEAHEKKKLPLLPEARETLIGMADGDGRALLNFCEILFACRGKPLDAAALTRYVQKRAPLYDKKQEAHYNLISALHKSLRGSDVQAALYWLARMLDGGEQPLYIVRRLVRFAAEDVGLADPNALVQAIAAKDMYDFLGSPEGELGLAQLVIYLATAPKSNAAYMAQGAAARAAREHGSLMPPMHILNAPTRLMADLGYGKGYAYDHQAEDAFSGRNYFPDGMKREEYYQPAERGFEREILKRLEYWEKLRKKKHSD
ncbi:MAG: replication-associated recombination protein A [Pseudomonadota bacterium]|nr:replication-associated recombination protein A [Pseudomonadota bacterium]MDE3038640.1 replication-associated recombination protein A [Pseudomonadota bacterium]